MKSKKVLGAMLLVLAALPTAFIAAQTGDGKPGESKKAGVPVPAVPAFDKEDKEAYGKQIALYKDLYEQGWVDEVAQGVMTLYDAGGDSVRRTYRRMGLEDVKDGDRYLIKFLSPAEIKSVAALTHENSGSTDDNWLYLPSNKRVRRISGANNTASFQGTEFTYEDLATLDAQEYQWRFLEETTIERDGKTFPVFKLNAVPTYKDTGYSRLLVYVHREHWRHERIEFFDKAGRLLKTREVKDWRHIHKRFWRERFIDMMNHQTGKRTTLEQSKNFLNMSLYKSKKTGKPRKNLSRDLFTTRALEN